MRDVGWKLRSIKTEREIKGKDVNTKWERKTLPKPRRSVRYRIEPSLCQRDLQQAVDDAMEAQKSYHDKWRSENMKVNRMIEDMVSK